MKKYKVVRTYSSDNVFPTEQLENAFEDGWQFETVTPIEKDTLEYILSKEITAFH